MAANGQLPGATAIPEPPSLDLSAAVNAGRGNAATGAAASNAAPGGAPRGPGGNADVPPLTPLGALVGHAVTPGALPLLVRMPDGNRRQIELPPNATVRDLRTSLEPTLGQDDNWDLEFASERLDDASTLAQYNIPHAYDHAGGLLKLISDSGNLDDNQKLEALNTACTVVQGISRGERDMERLISAAFDDDPTANTLGTEDRDADEQPSLRAMRKSKRSFPSLNLSSLATGTSHEKSDIAAEPPTPSQLIRKLSVSKPNLFPPGPANQLMRDMESMPGASASALPMISSASGAVGTQVGTLKEGTTWFEDVMHSLAPNRSERGPPPVEGDSEDELSGGEQDVEHDLDDGASEKADSSVGGSTPTAGMSDAAIQSQRISSGKHSATATAKTEETLAQRSAQGGGGTTALSESSMESSRVTDTGTAADRTPGVSGTSGTPAGAPTNGGKASAVPSTAMSSTAAGTAGAGAAPAQPANLPKKRGRKRKNPELSEEQRKALRQAQNRASAKQSRIRRKTMAAEYEKRVNTLEGENEHLRDTVAALSDRLQFLQTLLTVSVKRHAPSAAAAAAATGGSVGVGVGGPGGMVVGGVGGLSQIQQQLQQQQQQAAAHVAVQQMSSLPSVMPQSSLQQQLQRQRHHHAPPM